MTLYCAFFLNSLGVTDKACLKILQKYMDELNPHAAPISRMDRSELTSRLQAFWILMLLMYCIKVSPVASLKIRHK